MSKIYIGGIDARSSEREIEDEFRPFGPIRKVWVARRPPGFAFVEYDDPRDAQDAVRKLDGKHGWRVEISRKPDARGGSRDGREGCYECGDTGHFARECPKRGRHDRRSPPRRRSRSPPRRRSRSPPRRERSPPPREERRRSRSPSPARDKAPEKRSPSPAKRTPPRDGAPPPAADATSV